MSKVTPRLVMLVAFAAVIAVGLCGCSGGGDASKDKDSKPSAADKKQSAMDKAASPD